MKKDTELKDIHELKELIKAAKDGEAGKEPTFDFRSHSASDIVQEWLDRYLSAKDILFWLIGTICLIAVLIVVSHFADQSLYLPFLTKDRAGISTTLNTHNIIWDFYFNLAKGIVTFNELLKIFLLIFIIFNLFITLLKAIIGLLSKLKRIPDLLSKFCKKDKIKKGVGIKVYKLDNWLANPIGVNIYNTQGNKIYPPLRKRIGSEIKSFKSIKFDVSVLGDYDHWRAGIFIFNGENSNQDYVFHVYKNRNDSRLLTKMTKRIFTEGHKDERDKDITGIIIDDNKNFSFEVKYEEKDTYSLHVNGQEVDRYNVPKRDFGFLEIGAWADDNPYEIEFKNIVMKVKDD